MDTYIILAIILTVVAAIGAGLYMSDAGGDMTQWMAERFFKAKLRAEQEALQHAGSEKAQSFLKDQMKKNPMVSSDELDQVSEGLGEEAKEFEGKGGLGAMLGK